MSRILFFTVTLSWLSATGFADDSPDGGSAGNSSRRRTQQVEDGYVFIDGQYLPPPYEIAELAEGVTINGKLINASLPAPGSGRLGHGEPRHRNSGFAASMNRQATNGEATNRRSKGAGSGKSASENLAGENLGSRNSTGDRRSSFSAGPSLQSRVVHRLRNNSILLFFEKELVIIDPRNVIQFMRLMKTFDLRSEPYRALIGSLSEEKDRQLLAAWLKTYQPSRDLLERANQIVEAYDLVEINNRAQNSAARRIDQFSYPITVLGMVLAVLASGHLLNSRPANHPDGAVAGTQPTVLRAAVVSVAFVVFFSALDLVWTILAHQAGQMRELNPLGMKLIQDPVQLIAFKLTATVVSCAILFGLRHYHIARLASWWSCLACTILAFRWLTFNSMFLGS